MSATELKLSLARRLRQCSVHNIVDQTGTGPGEVAIYTLCDPRDFDDVRYVGQTRDPVTRFAQHVNGARLWLPDETPWWIRRPALRPLYEWIRALYADGGRLPVMFVVGWTTAELARSDERRFVRAFIAQDLPLLNHEAALLRVRRRG